MAATRVLRPNGSRRRTPSGPSRCRPAHVRAHRSSRTSCRSPRRSVARRTAAGRRARSRAAPRPCSSGLAAPPAFSMPSVTSDCSSTWMRPGSAVPLEGEPQVVPAHEQATERGGVRRAARRSGVRSVKPSPIPHSTSVIPAATNARPRVGEQVAKSTHVERLSGRAGTGTRRMRSCSTSPVLRRASWVSPRGDDAVRQDRQHDGLDVVGQHVVAALEGRVGAGRRGAGAGWRAVRRRAAGPSSSGWPWRGRRRTA